MNPRFGRRQWVKLWVNEWLDGTTRYEMSDVQRAFWIDLLALAGRSRYPGRIFAGETPEGPVGYPLVKFASQMTSPIDIQKTLRLFERTGKIKLTKTCESPELFMIELLNWDRYQSEYQRQKKYRGGANKIKLKAQQVVSAALKNGTIKKADHCQRCGKSEKLEAHHYRGYEEQDFLEVLWLCKGCHEEVHHDPAELQESYRRRYTRRNTTEGEGEGEVEVEEEKRSAEERTPLPPREFATPNFLRVFEAYPNKIDKREAIREWCRLPFVEKEETEKVLAGIAIWKASEQWQNERFIPNLAKFLKNRRWETLPPKPTKEKPHARKLEGVELAKHNAKVLGFTD